MLENKVSSSDANLSSTVAWTDHKAFLLSGIRNLFDNGKHSDFTIKCHERVFKVHKLVLGLFTEYFRGCDGLWMRINVNPMLMEKVLKFMYYGQVVVNYDEMEGFLHTCKFLGIKLFKAADINAEGMRGDDEIAQSYQERYELNDFQLMCRNCFKCFPDDKSMKKHSWACLRPRNFKCRFCEKSFRFKNDIENHERVHTGERPFICPKEGCGKSFKLKNARAIHIQVAHEGFHFKCDICGKGLTSKTKLKDHQAAVHSTDRPYACLECGKCFALNAHLKVHMKGHLPKDQRPKPQQRKKKEMIPTKDKLKLKQDEAAAAAALAAAAQTVETTVVVTGDTEGGEGTTKLELVVEDPGAETSIGDTSLF